MLSGARNFLRSLRVETGVDNETTIFRHWTQRQETEPVGCPVYHNPGVDTV